MKAKILGEKMLAQCLVCKDIKMETTNKYTPIVWKASIATFDHLPVETCFKCTQ